VNLLKTPLYIYIMEGTVVKPGYLLLGIDEAGLGLGWPPVRA
jgi:hypothetical protein